MDHPKTMPFEQFKAVLDFFQALPTPNRVTVSLGALIGLAGLLVTFPSLSRSEIDWKPFNPFVLGDLGSHVTQYRCHIDTLANANREDVRVKLVENKEARFLRGCVKIPNRRYGRVTVTLSTASQDNSWTPKLAGFLVIRNNDLCLVQDLESPETSQEGTLLVTFGTKRVWTILKKPPPLSTIEIIVRVNADTVARQNTINLILKTSAKELFNTAQVSFD